MGEITKIEWCDHTLNGVRGCAKVRLQLVVGEPEAGCHPSGCDHCYAESMSKRNPALLGIWGEEGTRVLASEQMWREPLRWFRDAVKAGRRARVFAYSLGDVFETPSKPDNAAVCDEARRRLWPLIEATGYGWNRELPLEKAKDPEWLRANASGGLDWLLLTKRPENIMRLIPESWRAGLPPNVWIGTSVENQAAADTRIPHLLRVPARVRFLSCEPLLERIDLTREPGGTGPSPLPSRRADGSCSRCALPWLVTDSRSPQSPRGHTCPPGFEDENIHLVIVGGESGHHARPFDIAWARDLRDQCRAAAVPYFLKQAGAHVIWNGTSAPGEHWPEGTRFSANRPEPPAAWRVRVHGWRAHLNSPKGGDLAELPEDLRIREMPGDVAEGRAA